MRRARHKLQVSTFPFLAVLLGAMGSLIFLLLVMDRRAKIVARNKMHEAQSLHLAAHRDEERRRQEEFEIERRKLHDALAAQDQNLRGQLQSLLGEVARSEQQLQAQQAAQRQLQDLIETEQNKLMRDRDELRTRQAHLTKTAQRVEASKSELTRVTRELLELEDALAGLQRLKSQQQPTYSLVPYRGQRGENRMPIYVECTRTGLVFLPDRLTITGADLDFPAIRSEVERRHGPLVKAQKKVSPFAASQVSDEPYVLFLIRPDGINSYYRGQNALRGFQIDFGYELIDSDWTIDVSMRPNTPQAAQGAAGNRNQAGRPPQSANSFPGSGSGPSATPAPPHETGPLAGGNVAGAPTANPGAPGSFRGVPGILPLDPAHVGDASVARGPIAAASLGKPGFAGAPMFRPSVSVGGGTTLLDAPVPGLKGPAAGVTGVPGTRLANGFPGSQGSASGPGSDVQVRGNGAGGNAPRGTANPQATRTDTTNAPTQTPPSPMDAGRANESPSTVRSETAAPPHSDAEPENAQLPSARPSASSVNEGPVVGNAINRLAPPSLAPPELKKPRDGPPPLGRVIGNRDFIVTLSCYEEGVLVTPGGASFLWNASKDSKTIDEALVRTVSQLVTRRQATVRTGEPPYRPVLRFEVHDRGRRTYHHVYPLLERLRLAMVREDVQQ